jgi:mRNA interferase RelE/StbE
MYSVSLTKSAKKDLSKIISVYYDSVSECLRALANDPRPFGSVKLTGFENTYCIRVGIYRIIYTIEDKILTVKVVKIDHRKTVYR